MSPHVEPISMYVPARNAAATLGDCVASIRAQTRPPDELFLVVDPRSTDATCEVAHATGLRVIEQTGGTLGAARNDAVRLARHRWLASCDSDVVLERDWLERLAARRKENVAGIAGRTNERVLSVFDDWRGLHMPHHWGEHPLRNPFMLVSEVIFDRAALLGVGGYRDDLNYYEDSDLCQRLRDAGHDLFYEPSAVATHLRRDTLLSLLNLRWRYAEYRQRHLMDRYAGLIQKLSVNREYAVTTLARSLAHDRPAHTYICFLLFFHHLLLDHRSLLARRPLLDEPQRRALERGWLSSALDALGEHDATLAAAVERDLGGLFDGEAAGQVAYSIPGWSNYLREVRTASTAFVGELHEVLPLIGWAADQVSEPRPHSSAPAVPQSSAERLGAALAAQCTAQVLDAALLDSVRRQWPDVQMIRPMGLLTRGEQDALALSNPKDANGVAAVIVPHLEGFADPAGALAEVNGDVKRLVVCYAPPGRFITGMRVLSAADLASTAAGLGWTIERFDTLVGRTRLMLRR